jgi:hypothetical protein
MDEDALRIAGLLAEVCPRLTADADASVNFRRTKLCVTSAIRIVGSAAGCLGKDR